MPNLESAIELRRAGNLAEAEARCRESLAAEPSNAAALALLGMLLGEAGRHCDAAAVLERSVVLRPDQPQAWYNLGVARERGGDLTAAARAYRRAVGLAPRFAEAHRRLGSVLYKAGRNAQAAECLRAAVQLRPDFSDAWGALAKACGELGWQAEATACRRRVVELRPDSAAEHSRLLYDLHYDPAISPEEMFEEHLHWARRHADPLSASGGGEAPTRLSSSKSAGPRFASEPRLGRSLALPFAPRGDCPVGRRLRVGYVSADFRAHPVARFQEPVLANHDHDAFEVFCYSDAATPDATTERLRSYADVWRETRGLTEEQLAQMIREDRIDVLVDLAGHSAGNRLLAFARRPAPLQVTCNGYIDTTGMAAMDYRLTDALHDPPGATDHLQTERLVRLPACNWCYRPDDSPPVSLPPGLSTGVVTFGCLNKLYKVTPQMLDIWARILKEVPHSRLLLVVQGGDAANPSVRESLVGRGIDSERVEVLSKAASRREYLERFGRVDVALDTFPFNGITTTCDALWMGVPVVSLCGQTHVSRAGLSILTAIGLGDLACATPDEYVRCATQLGTHTGRVSAIRAGLRERMERSPLRDERGYARAVEAAYRAMWVD